MHGSGVSVITVCPGFIITPMAAKKRYRLPFVVKAEDAAAKIACIVEEKKLFSVIPWQMGIVATILKLLPNFLYDRIFAQALRKPR
jgi:short-subunit dehydrogenase